MNKSASNTPSVPSVVDRIGPYRLLRQLGAGGMSIVYLAEEIAPVERLVALKVFALPLADDKDVERFLREQTILGKLDHPDIARFLDSGRLPTGEVYYAMEYFPGEPITHFCSKRGASLNERIRLMVQVCDTVTYAHQQGIIHRDLKPANILVAEIDGDIRIKVIDFGIAKETGPSSPQLSLTRSLQVLGTPLYMSPEHLQPETHSIDTRSDLFSLASILVELLCGKAPCDTPRAHELGILEIQRLLLSDVPIPLFSEMDRPIDRELQWIAGKGLEKKKERRYSSVASFAEDLNCYLKHQPVLAGPPSSFYRLQKFVLRYRWAVAATLVTIAALGASTLFSLQQWHIAEQAQETAERELYYAEMKLASDSAWAGDLAFAKRILDRNNPELHPKKWVGVEWNFLNAALQREPLARRNCGARVIGLKLSPDKKHLIVLPDSFQIQIWDPLRLLPLKTIETESWPLGLDWHPNSKRFATGGRDGKIRVFDISEESLSKRGTVEPVTSFVAHDDDVNCLAFHPDGRLLISGSDDGTIRIWDTDTWKRVRKVPTHSPTVEAIAISTDGKQLVSGGRGAPELKLWNFADLRRIESWPTARRIQTVAISPTDKFMFAGDVSGELILKELGGARRIASSNLLDGVEQLINLSGAEKTDPVRIATADRGGRLSVHSLESQEPWLNITSSFLDRWQIGSTRATSLCQLSGDLLLAGDLNGDISQWSLHRPAYYEITAENLEKDRYDHYCKTSQSEVLLFRRRENLTVGRVEIYDLSTRSRIDTPLTFDFPVTHIEFSEPSQRLFLVGGDRLEVWDYSRNERIATWKTCGGAQNLAISPDGSRILNCCDMDNGCWVQCFQVGREEPLFEFFFESGTYFRTRFVDNDKFALAKRNELWIYPIRDIQYDSPRLKLVGHDSTLADHRLLDGNRIVTVAHDRLMKVWDYETGKLLGSQEGDSGELWCVAVSDDRSRMVTGSSQGSLKLWDTSTVPFRELLRLPVERGSVFQVDFAMNGKQIVVRADGGRVVCFAAQSEQVSG